MSSQQPFVPSSATPQPPTAAFATVVRSREDVRACILEHLFGDGYRPVISIDGNVEFKAEGLVYIVECFAQDLYYARISLPWIWEVDEENRDRVERVAASVSAQFKAVKMPVGSWVSPEIEMFYSAPQHFCEVLPRCIAALREARQHFYKEMSVDSR